MTNDNLRRIGAFCFISDNVKIVPNDHRMDWVTTSPIMTHREFGFKEKDCVDEYMPSFYRATYIGNDVWIGTGTVIFEGVTIGDGAVIGANSVIRKNVEPYAIVVGTDRVLRHRFSRNIIEKLLKIQWWNWDNKKIKDNLDILRCPEKMVARFYEEK